MIKLHVWFLVLSLLFLSIRADDSGTDFLTAEEIAEAGKEDDTALTIDEIIGITLDLDAKENDPLTDEEFTQAADLEVEVPEETSATENENLFEGDMDLNGKSLDWYTAPPKIDKDNETESFQNAIRGNRFRWPNAKVPYKISPSFSRKQRLTIAHAIGQYHKKTCIRFVHQTNERDYLYFGKYGGCWSYVGRQGGHQQVSIGYGCEYTGIVQHEIMHALGFFHEQSRNDRDQYVTVNYQNIRSGFEGNFKSYSLDRIDHLNTRYDYHSIMHYGSTAFSKNGQPTIVVKSGSNSVIGNRKGLSTNDVTKLKRMYCGETTDTACVDVFGGGCQYYLKYCYYLRQRWCCATCRKYGK